MTEAQARAYLDRTKPIGMKWLKGYMGRKCRKKCERNEKKHTWY